MSDIIDLPQPCVTVLINEIERTVLDHFEVEVGTTVQQWVDDFGYDIYSSPFVFYFNSEPLVELDWDKTTFQKGDVLTLVGQPGIVLTGGALIAFWVMTAIVIASTAYTLYTILTMDTPDPSDDAASPNYNISYRGNRARRDQVRPVIYGEMKVWPDSIGEFKFYEEDQQWITQLFEVTLGETEEITDADIYYEDTPLTNFTGYSFEYCPPGTESELFPSDEIVSSEVQNLTVDAAGPTTSYVVCPPGVVVNAIYWDVSMPQGHYRIDSDGDFEMQSTLYELQYRKIDDSGNPVGGGDWGVYSVWMQSNQHNPIRRTFSLDLTDPLVPGGVGRYEARINRLSAPNNQTNIMDTFVWDGLRGTSVESASDTLGTRIAVRLRQSEKIGNLALGQLNCVVQRKIPSWSGNSPTGATAHTRSSVLAFCDVVTAWYGGNLSTDRLDLDGLKALDDENRAYSEFSGVYDTASDMWKVLNDIARMHLGVAVEVQGGKYTIIPDDPNVAPIMLVGQDRVIAGSFQQEQTTIQPNDYDYIVVTYKDKADNYREHTVECVPFGSPKNHPQQIVLRGPTSDRAAWRIGIRMINEFKWRRHAVNFAMGLDGLIPIYGDTIRVAHFQLDILGSPKGYSGAVSSLAGSTLTVYEDVSSLIGEPGLVVFVRNLDGTPQGPLSATVTGTHTIDAAGINGSQLQFDDDAPRPTFAIGKGETAIKTIKVTSLKTTDQHTVEIGGFVDEPNVYIEDQPPSFELLDPPKDLTPTVTNLNGDMYGDTGKARVKLTWVGHYSDYYIVEISTDNKATWGRVGRTAYEHWDGPVPQQNNLWMRVFGVGLVFGPPAEIGFNVADYALSMPPIENLRASSAFIGSGASIEWNRPPKDLRVTVEVWWNGKLQRTETVPYEQTIYVYNWWMAWVDDPYTLDGAQWPKIGCRSLEFRCYMTNTAGFLAVTPQTITLNNEQMDFLLNATYEERGTSLVIDFQWPDTDTSGVDIHLSTTQGFTPDLAEGSATRIYRGHESNITIAGVLSPNTTYYLLMAGYDIWGATDDLNWSNETQIDTGDDVVGGPIEWDDIQNIPPNVHNSPVMGIRINSSNFIGNAQDGKFYLYGYEYGVPADAAIIMSYFGDTTAPHTFGPLSGEAKGHGSTGWIVYCPNATPFFVNGANTNVAYCYWFIGVWRYANGTNDDGTLFDPLDGVERYAIAELEYDSVAQRITTASAGTELYDLKNTHFLVTHALWAAIDGDGKPDDNAQENVMNVGVTRNQASFGGGDAPGQIFLHGFKNGSPVNEAGFFDWNGTRRWIGPGSINCKGIDLAGFLAVDVTESGLIGGFDAAMVYWKDGVWYLQREDELEVVWGDYDNDDVCLIGGIDTLNDRVTKAVLWPPESVDTYHFLLSHAQWSMINDDDGNKPEDGAQQNEFSLGITRNQSTFGGPQTNGYCYIHGYVNGQPSDVGGYFTYNSQRRVVNDQTIDCRGYDAGCLLAVDMGNNGRIGGKNIGLVFWINGIWFLQEPTESLIAWTDYAHEDCVLIGGIDVAADRVTKATLWPATSVDTYTYLYSYSLWESVQDPTGTKPEDNAEVNAPSITLRKNNSSFNGAADGWLYVHGFQSGVAADVAGKYEFNGQTRTVGPIGINCRNVDASGYLAVDVGNGGNINGANVAFVIFLPFTNLWYTVDGTSTAVVWSNWTHEDVVILGDINVTGGRITQATINAPRTTRVVLNELVSSQWDSVGDPGGTKPEDYAQPNAEVGANVIPQAYHTFHNGEVLFHSYTGDDWAGVADNQGYFQDAAMFVNTDGGGAYAVLSQYGSVKNIPVEPGSKWILSFWAKTNTTSGTGKVQFQSNTGSWHQPSNIENMAGGGVFYPNTTWTQYKGLLDLSSATSVTALAMFCHNDTGSSKTIYFDGLSLSKLANPNIVPAANNIVGLASGVGVNAVKTEILIPDATTGILNYTRSTDVYPAYDTWTYFGQSNFSWRKDNIVTFECFLSWSWDGAASEDMYVMARFKIDGTYVGFPALHVVNPANVNVGGHYYYHQFIPDSSDPQALVELWVWTGVINRSGRRVLADGSSFTLTEIKR